MIFFILSFFFGYILSFSFVRLRTIWLSAGAGAHIECRCSRSCVEGVAITDIIIKTLDGKRDLDVDDVMPGSKGLGILVIIEKKQLRSDAGRSELRFGPGRGQSSCGLQDAPRVCWVSELRLWTLGRPVQLGSWLKNDVETVTIVKVVSLYPHVEKLKVKKS